MPQWTRRDLLTAAFAMPAGAWLATYRLHAAPLPRVLEFLREHAALRSEPFVVDGLQLFRSVLGHDGAQHVLEASYPLFPGRPGPAPCPGADLPPGQPLS